MSKQPRYTKGQRIGGRYLVHQALMGGMGEVYLCLDELENLPYALKTFKGSDSRLRELFKSEVENWIALEKHPNIVRLFHTENLDNIPFMVLEWIASDESKGTDLRSWLRHGALDLPLALRFTIDIVRGLQHANEKVPGIVHRDLKPDNVLVNQSRQAKITDFGLATVAQIAGLDMEGVDESDMGRSRYVGAIVGTPAYMPPEQWRGETDLDFRTDIYAVGCILYELLTGKMLYEGRTISELRAQHIEAPIPALNDDLPVELKFILDGCLGKRREYRYVQLAQLIDDLIYVYQANSTEPLPEVNTEAFTAGDYSNRGLTFTNLGQNERAIQDHDRAIRLNPNLAPVYLNRGASYHTMGQYKRAIQDYDQAIRLNPNDAKAYYNRGTSYHNLGQHERVIQDSDQAIRLDPNLALAYSNRGLSYADLGQYEQAIQDYDQALRLDPNLASAYMNRGLSYARMGQYERSIHDFDHAIHLDPNLASAYLNKAVALAMTNRLEEAIEWGQKAAQLGEPRAHELIARAHQMIEQAQAQPTESEQEQAVQLIAVYQKHGESVLKQVLSQQGFTSVEINELITLIKQDLGE